MINRAAREEARGARNLFPDHRMPFTERVGQAGVSGSKEGDHWNADGRRQMHGARIAADQDSTTAKEGRKNFQPILADKRRRGMVEAFGNVLPEPTLPGASQKNNIDAVSGAKAVRKLSVPLRPPELGRAKGSPQVDSGSRPLAEPNLFPKAAGLGFRLGANRIVEGAGGSDDAQR